MPCDPELRYHFTAGYDGGGNGVVSQREEDDRATHWKLYSSRIRLVGGRGWQMPVWG